MLNVRKVRHICIAFLILFMWSSFASLDGFVLCTDEGRAAGIEPVHAPHMVCMTKSDPGCCHSDKPKAEITHHHIPCTGLPLGANLGHIQDPERLPELSCLWASCVPVRGSDVYSADDPETALAETSVFELVPASLQHLQFVILLI